MNILMQMLSILCIILKLAIPHNKYLYGWYFESMLIVILLYFYLNRILNVGFVYVYTAVLLRVPE